MKIVQVCPRYYPNIGGVESHVKEISERLAARHEIEVVTADFSGVLPHTGIINGVKVTRFTSLGPKEAYYLSPEIYGYLKKIQPDILHAHNYHALPALFAAKAARCRFIFTPHYHGKGSTPFRDFLNRPYSLLGKSIFNRAERVICVSMYEKELIRKHFPEVETQKFAIIPNGIPLNSIREAPLYPKTNNLILYIGRLDRYKNIHLVIQSMKYLPGASFVIIGSSGNYRNHLEKLIRELKLDNQVRILDKVSDAEKYSYLKSCSLFMNLSGTEAFGITVLEAIAAGKQVIVNRKGALSEFAENFKGVTVVDADQIHDESGFRQLAILMRENMGNDLNRDVSSYEWDSVVDRLESVYLDRL